MYYLIDNFNNISQISKLTTFQQIKEKSSCKCLKKKKDYSKSNKMIIYAKISQNIFLLVFLLTRLHDNELKLFIHDFEYSTIDNTGSRQSFRSSEARKKFNHTSLYEGQGSPRQLSHLHLSLLLFTGQYLTEFLLINVHIDQFYRFE